MGKSPNVYSFPGTAELASSLRQYVLTQQQAAIERHNKFRVAVSGGSLPKTLAQALLQKGDGTAGDTVDFSKWEVFFADERCVPLSHQDSNYKLLKEELLDKIDEGQLGKPTVFSISEKYVDDAQECADEYEKQLVSVFAARDSVKLPTFDLLLLGCGPDGHTCSLFPEHPLLRESDAWVLSISDSPKPPPKRITLSLPVVLHGSKIAFVATGSGKREIFKKMFESEEGRALPCGLINEGAGEKVSWFTDNAALEGVSVARKGSL
jgi:6-phosphogluconolactonase